MSNDHLPSVLPPPLLQAASQANGRIVLVLGAGCSFVSPTSVPMAQNCSREAYRRLVHDGVLRDGDCPNVDDLSVLADTVFEKRTSQGELVDRLPIDQFRRAHPNAGHLIAAALLRENVIASILTLNFDLAMENALTQLGARDVQTIACPENVPHFAAHNVVYLHRNVEEVNREKWVLRTSALASEWRQGWEDMMARAVLMSPVVVFVGLGSPAAVLIETTQRIKQCIEALHVYQVDPSPAANNAFFQALALPESAFVQLGWNEFMEQLGNRVAAEQIDALRVVCASECQAENFVVRDVEIVIERFRSMGLVEMGRIRAAWLSLADTEFYAVPSESYTSLMAHAVVAVSTVSQEISAQNLWIRSEIVVFREASGNVLTCAMMASGRGTRGWIAIEAEVHRRRAALPRQDPQPRFAIIVGAAGRQLNEMVAPPDIVVDLRPAGDILGDETSFALIDAHTLSISPERLREVL